MQSPPPPPMCHCTKTYTTEYCPMRVVTSNVSYPPPQSNPYYYSHAAPYPPQPSFYHNTMTPPPPPQSAFYTHPHTYPHSSSTPQPQSRPVQSHPSIPAWPIPTALAPVTSESEEAESGGSDEDETGMPFQLSDRMKDILLRGMKRKNQSKLFYLIL